MPSLSIDDNTDIGSRQTFYVSISPASGEFTLNSGEKHILIVEDDGFLRDGLAMLLEREQFTVRLAGSLREAEAALNDDTCLIILDVGLPDGNGFDYC